MQSTHSSSHMSLTKSTGSIMPLIVDLNLATSNTFVSPPMHISELPSKSNSQFQAPYGVKQ